MTLDRTTDVLVRLARMRAAKAGPQRGASATIAALTAGSGAELVARSERACMVMEVALRRRANRKGQAGGAAPRQGEVPHD